MFYDFKNQFIEKCFVNTLLLKIFIKLEGFLNFHQLMQFFNQNLKLN